MNWITRWRRLSALGIMGMNHRNTQCIPEQNPRRLFPVVDAKSKMQEVCERLGVPTPDLYAIIAAHSALRHLPRILSKRSEFVLKPDRGAGGRGVLVLTGREGNRFVRSNGERLDFAELHQHVSSIISGLFSLGGRPDAALVQQRVVPDPVFAAISFEGTPDVRVILYKNKPVMAMLRLPTKISSGRANLHQGAVGVGVDLGTGITVHAVLKNAVTDRHPDTGSSVLSVPVPHWTKILDMSCKVSRAVGLGYVGVDIVLDRVMGPLVLEANARPGLSIQIANCRGLIPALEEIDRLEAAAAAVNEVIK